MAKTAAKRKPETIPVPTTTHGSKKQRTANPLSRPASSVDDDGLDSLTEGGADEYELPPYTKGGQKNQTQAVRIGNGMADGAARKGPGGRGRQMEDVEARSDEYDEDVGRLESQDFLRLVEGEGRKKKMAAKAAGEYQKRFTAKITQEEKELARRLKQLDDEATNRDDSFSAAFAKAYALSTPCEPQTSTSHSGRSNEPIDPEESMPPFSALYTRSRNLTSRAFKIIHNFEHASHMAETIAASRLLENDWQEEDELAGEILRIGMEVGVERHRLIVGAGREREMEAETETEKAGLGAGEIEAGVDRAQVERLLFVGDGEGGECDDRAGSVKGYEAMGWGRMAKKQERGVKKLVKGLGKWREG